MLVSRLPPDLEDADALLKRRAKAKERKDKWVPAYRDVYRYAMPQRETFGWDGEGTQREVILYDSTLQEATYTAANTLCALLFPGWSRWADLAPGADIDKRKITPEIKQALRDATETFFEYLNHSNFAQVSSETAQDLMAGTGGLVFDEGDDQQPFVFNSMPLPLIEIEEGPNGTIETKYMLRKPLGRHLLRMYPGMEVFDLPMELAESITQKPDDEVEVVQCEIYHPETKKYFGVVVSVKYKTILWRYDYGESCPTIIARATKVSGELYGRGRAMLALADARTLDKMQEFVLRRAALDIGGVFTGVSDGVLNPYTTMIAPNTIIPVASNDSGNPSLRPLDIGGNFNITDKIMTDLRQRVRRTMLGPEPSEGAVRSATEVSVNDRNRLWAMGGEYGRIQAELVAKIIARGVFILQRKGKIPRFRVDGREVMVKYTSPFARSQDAEDALAVLNTLTGSQMLGPEITALGIKVEELPAYLGRKYGMEPEHLRSDDERDEKTQALIDAMTQAMSQQGAPA